MMTTHIGNIVLVNRTTVLTDDQVKNIIPALQAQVTTDFSPVWGLDATLGFFGIGDPDPGPGTWPLLLLDTTDQPGAGGYHLDQSGQVFGRVFCRDAIDAGDSWTIDASHELLEMLADPTAGTDPSQYVWLQGGEWTGKQCLREVCDACEAEQFGYSRLGADGSPVMLSDFVTPGYFFLPDHSGHFDFGKHLKAAAPALLVDGYLGIFDPATGDWSQVSNFRRGEKSARAKRMHRTRERMMA